MPHRMLTVLLLTILFFPPQTDELTIQAEYQERDGNIARYTGNVVVTYQDLQVVADTITYNTETQEVIAGDQVVFTRADERLEASTVRVDLTTKAGVLVDVRGTVGGYFITAAEAR